MSTDVIPQFDEHALDCEVDCCNHCIDSASLTRLNRYCMVSPTFLVGASLYVMIMIDVGTILPQNCKLYCCEDLKL